MTHKNIPAETIIHFVFTPYCRRPLLAGLEAAAEREFRHIAQLKGMTIHALAVQSDHVHILVALPRVMSTAQAAHLLKWFVSIWLRQDFPHLRGEKRLWGHRYWHHSVGGGTAAINQYINDQGVWTK